MAWIKTVDESEAKGIVKQVYEATKKVMGRISPMLQAMSLRPRAMQAVARLSRAIIFGASGLTRAQEDMIAVVVASANGCRYWGWSHGEQLLPNIGNDRQLLDQLRRNWRDARLDDRTLDILAFAEKITLEPYAVHESDLNLLRDKGFSDEIILDVVLIASQSNLTNRISLSLGVEPLK
jgi:uncharacterized peroxidase-related enzyme